MKNAKSFNCVRISRNKSVEYFQYFSLVKLIFRKRSTGCARIYSKITVHHL